LELPSDIRKWLLQDHLALFISEVVDFLDFRQIAEDYLHLQGGQRQAAASPDAGADRRGP
jgi:hypothetical protein